MNKWELHKKLSEVENKTTISVDDLISIYGDDREHHQDKKGIKAKRVKSNRASILADTYNLDVKLKKDKYIFKVRK